MAHSFEIRFARSAGLAGLLEAPANPFRWKGAGRIRIDEQGVVIYARRSLLSWLRRPAARRIDAASLTEVYREGAALRVEFANEAGAREILPLWALDPKSAADIVRVMPTLRTVEFDHAVSGTVSPFEWDRPVLVLLIAGMGCMGFLAWLLWTPAGTSPVTPHLVVRPDTTKLVSSGSTIEAEAPATSPDPPTPDNDASDSLLEPELQSVPLTLVPPKPPMRVEVHVEPIARGTAAYEAARRALENFDAAAAALRTDYHAQQALFQSNALTSDQFADYLRSSLEMRWWNLTFEILANDALTTDQLLDFRATLLASARHWRGFLDGYAEGLLRLDHVMIAESFDRMSIAEELQSRARRFAPP
jgi:hypothetical protein